MSVIAYLVGLFACTGVFCEQVKAQALIFSIIVGMSAYIAAGTRREQRANFRLLYMKVPSAAQRKLKNRGWNRMVQLKFQDSWER